MTRVAAMATRAALGAWLAGLVVGLAAWAWFWDPARAADVPAWLGQVASRLGHGDVDAGTGAWRVDAFWARLTITRLMMAGTAAIAALLAVVHRDALRRQLVEFFTEPRFAVDLAIFRIVLFATIYLETPTGFIRQIAALPAALQFPPETGVPRLGPLAGLAYWPRYPFAPEQVAFACGVLKAACVAGMLGIRARSAALVVSVLFFAGWGSIQWFGKVDHHHHLLWFALILAAARSGDALSVDAWWSGRRGGPGVWGPARASSAYGMPLAFCMLLIGVIYFFPGFWKLATSGLDWALGDNLRHTMQMKWRSLGDWTPAVRFDHHPWLYRGGGLAVLLFEVSFVFLVIGRRTRLLAAFYGLAFHFGTQQVMRISFWSLRNCYVVFFGWRRLVRAFTGADEPAPDRSARPLAVILVGSALVLGNVWAGALKQMDGWPLACYPLFNGIVGESYETMRIVLVRADGSEREIVAADHGGAIGDRWGQLLDRILDERDPESQRARLSTLWHLVAADDPTLADGELVRFESVETWLEPERWRDPPGRRRVIGELRLRG